MNHRSWTLLFVTLAIIGCRTKPSDREAPAKPGEIAPRAAIDAAPAASASSAPPSERALVAPEGTANLLGVVPSKVAVSSAVDNPRDFPEHLMDGRLDTAWNGKSGDLRPSISFRVPDDAFVERVDLTVGFDKKTAEHDFFLENHRIRRLALHRNGKKLREVVLEPNKRGWQAAPVGAAGGDFRVEILDTTPGTKKEWQEVVVSEMRVVGTPGKHRATGPIRIAVGGLDSVPPSLPPEPSSAQRPQSDLDGLCADYLRSVDRIWKSMLADPGDGPVAARRDQWKAPFCTPTSWSGVFQGDGHWRRARAVRVGYGIVDEARLAVELSRGWVLTPIAWDDKAGNIMGCPSVWVPKDVPIVKVENGYLVAYVDGESMTLVHPEPTADDTGWRLVLQRGLTWCYDTGSDVECKTHNPQYDDALDQKIQPRSQPLAPWRTLPWAGGKSFSVEPDGRLRILLVKPVRGPLR